MISAYKHILENNKDENGKITLTADDRKRLSVNFAGYDISPDMVRLSRVNMYLHKFTKPQISEYDTLTKEEKWNDSFDVILANPPFMTPKGGIIPHNRYRVQAKRAEVLFVDYIAKHLNPTGRAGIIVPEGIVFQSANAYKALRKYLVDDNLLYAVISLPSGVFQPYSGVKTSVLLFDKTFAKQKDEILFVKMDNDGYDLGAQRREIKKDDIPDIVNIVKAFKNGEDVSYSPLVTLASKEDIAKKDYILVGERYKTAAVMNSQWPLVELGEVAEYINGFAFKPTDWTEEGTPIIRIQNLTNSSSDVNRTTKEVSQKYNVEKGDLLISWSATIGFYIWHGENAYLNQHIFKVNPSEKILKLYLFYLRDAIIEAIKSKVHGNTMTHITKGTFDGIKIPLPPLSVQEEIVAEIESYQKIIDGAKQIVDNYKPTIKIDPSWEMVKLGDVCSLQNGYAFKSELFSETGIQVVKMGNVQKGKLELNKNISYYPLKYKEELKKFILGKGDILISLTGTQGKEDFGNVCMIDVNCELFLNQRVGKFEIQSKDLDKKYLYLILQMDSFRFQIFQNASGVRQGNISKSDIESFSISLPPLEIQHKIIENINEEMAIVEQNKRLIEIFEQKIKDKINEIWGKQH